MISGSWGLFWFASSDLLGSGGGCSIWFGREEDDGKNYIPDMGRQGNGIFRELAVYHLVYGILCGLDSTQSVWGEVRSLSVFVPELGADYRFHFSESAYYDV